MQVKRFQILSASAVEQLCRRGSSFRGFVERHHSPTGPVRRFPNGAIEVDDSRVGAEKINAMQTSILLGCSRIEGASVFRSLGPFTPENHYCIQYPADYQSKLKTEASFGISPTPLTPPAPSEFDLARLEVTVGFRTRMSHAVRHAFVDVIAAWGAESSRQGAFDDGPAALASSGIEFVDKRARFLVDSSQSGQDTLNWLALVVLGFGEDVHPATRVCFSMASEWLDQAFGPVRGDWMTIGFPQKRPLD